MANVAARLHERLSLAGRILPVSLGTASTVATSAAVDMSTASELLATLLIGGLTGTVGIALEHATSTAASDFGAFSTPVQATGITGGSQEQMISLHASDIPAGSRYIRAIITGSFSSTNTGLVGAVLQTEADYEPATHLSTTRTTVVS